MLFDRIQFWITYPGYSPSRFFAISDKEMKSFSKSLVYGRTAIGGIFSLKMTEAFDLTCLEAGEFFS